ncbi:hypothetical protein AAG570_009187 [Ranatra chinensis]|uniref:Uncharacterized protein n=1 Tax=Ranatra chinensis TaxID=642074 RepID=A0ABD0YT52_9HEMI
MVGNKKRDPMSVSNHSQLCIGRQEAAVITFVFSVSLRFLAQLFSRTRATVKRPATAIESSGGKQPSETNGLDPSVPSQMPDSDNSLQKRHSPFKNITGHPFQQHIYAEGVKEPVICCDQVNDVQFPRSGVCMHRMSQHNYTTCASPRHKGDKGRNSNESRGCSHPEQAPYPRATPDWTRPGRAGPALCTGTGWILTGNNCKQDGDPKQRPHRKNAGRYPSGRSSPLQTIRPHHVAMTRSLRIAKSEYCKGKCLDFFAVRQVCKHLEDTAMPTVNGRIAWCALRRLHNSVVPR